jgi:hypothetical protein
MGSLNPFTINHLLSTNKKAPQLQGFFVEKRYLIKKLLQSFLILYDQLKISFRSARWQYGL